MDWVAIFVSISGAVAGLTGLITFFVNRHDNNKKECCNLFSKEEKAEVISAIKKINIIELDTARLQLLNLIQHSPQNQDTILYQAKHYFKDLKGNTYMISVFCDWAKAQKIDDKIVNELIHNDK